MAQVTIPTPSSMTVLNLLGVTGLALVVAAVGGLAGLWWALGAAGLVLVALSVIGQTHLAAAEPADTAPAPVVEEPVRVAPVAARSA